SARRAVRRAVVALLAAVRHAVATLAAAGGRAAVARRRVAVVALFAELLDAVAAHRRVRVAPEGHPIPGHPMALGVGRRRVHDTARDQARQMRYHEGMERRADAARGDGRTALQGPRTGDERHAERFE